MKNAISSVRPAPLFIIVPDAPSLYRLLTERHPNSVCSESGFAFHTQEKTRGCIRAGTNHGGTWTKESTRSLKPAGVRNPGKQDVTPAALNASTSLHAFGLKCTLQATFNKHGRKSITPALLPSTAIPTGPGHNGVF